MAKGAVQIDQMDEVRYSGSDIGYTEAFGSRKDSPGCGADAVLKEPSEAIPGELFLAIWFIRGDVFRDGRCWISVVW